MTNTNEESQGISGAPLIEIQLYDEDKKCGCYHIRKNAPLIHLMRRWAESKELRLGRIVFIHNCQRLHGSETPEQLNMENKDMIEVFYKESRWEREIPYDEFDKIFAKARVFKRLKICKWFTDNY